MKFNAAAFDRHLTGIGQQVTWRRSYSCACVNPQSGQADPKHQLCGGKGRIWDAPIATVTGVASQKVQNQWAQMGQWENGDLVLSVPQSSPMWDAGKYDRVVMMNSDDVFSKPMVRGAPSERLLFNVATITRCFWLDPATRGIVDGQLPVVDAAGMLSWPNGGGPLPGATYSLTGTKRPEYFIWDEWPADRNQHSGMRLPKRTVLRNFDLFSR